jgi:hypothetical protein
MKSDSNTSEKQNRGSGRQGDERPPDKDATWTFTKKLRPDDPTLVPAVASCDDHKRNGRPPRDSPLTKAFAGQYLSSLVQETVTYCKISYKRLAQEMSLSETILREAVQGKLARTRGQWVRLGQLLSLPTNFELRPGERDGAPCWEVCYPPVSVEMDKA